MPGPISSVNALGTRMVILNDAQAAFDLLDKKASVYSDRPCPEFFGKVYVISVHHLTVAKKPVTYVWSLYFCKRRVGWQNALAFLSYGPQFREHRKKLHQTIGTRAAVNDFHTLIILESRRLLWRLVLRPQSLAKQIRL